MTRPGPHGLARSLGALGLAVALSVAPAMAQPAEPTRTPILVRVKIDSESLIRAWGQAESDSIAAGLAGAVATSLSDAFHHWSFDPAHARFYATLEVRLVETVREKVDIALDKVLSNGDRQTLWQEVWLKPTDFALGRRPPRDQAQGRLAATFADLFDASHRQRVRNWLRDVPIGASGTWTGESRIETLRIVTSLPWDRFKALEQSRLKVTCRGQGNRIELTTQGTDQRLPFHHRRLNSTYDALVLKPEEISDRELSPADLDHLIHSDVGLIFLIEEKDPQDAQFFGLSG